MLTPPRTRRSLRRSFALGAAAALAVGVTSGCLGPPSPFMRLGDVAYETNSATRFGRFDVAVSHVAPDVQEQFTARHQSWGSELRVLDVELTGVRMVDPDTAEVSVVVQWHRLDETNIRTTQLAQRYMRGEEDWQLYEERRISGAPGLFRADKPAKKHPKAKGGEPAETAPGDAPPAADDAAAPAPEHG